jgi:hypothetical protein
MERRSSIGSRSDPNIKILILRGHLAGRSQIPTGRRLHLLPSRWWTASMVLDHMLQRGAVLWERGAALRALKVWVMGVDCSDEKPPLSQ